MLGEFLDPERRLHADRLGLSNGEGNVRYAAALPGRIDGQGGRPNDVHALIRETQYLVHVGGTESGKPRERDVSHERVVDVVHVGLQVRVRLEVVVRCANILEATRWQPTDPWNLRHAVMNLRRTDGENGVPVRDRCEPCDIELHFGDLVSFDVVILGAPILLVQPQAGFMVDGQSLRTRQSAAGRPIFGRYLGDLLLVVERDDELVGVGIAGPRKTSIGNIVVNEGEPQFFVVLIHQDAELESCRRGWSRPGTAGRSCSIPCPFRSRPLTAVRAAQDPEATGQPQWSTVPCAAVERPRQIFGPYDRVVRREPFRFPLSVE